MIKTFTMMAENAGPWFDKLNSKEKSKIEKAVFRANKAIAWVKQNGLPKQYHGIGKKIAARCNANPSNLPDEAVFALDNTIVRTVEDQAIMEQVFSEVTKPIGSPRWENKNYKITELDVNSAKNWPNPDKSFRNPTVFSIGVEPEKQSGMGFSIAYEIPWTELAESKGSIYSPDFYYALVAAERMGIIIDEDIALGGAGLHMHYDTTLKGVINHASIQSFTATGLTTFGGIRTALFNALADMKGVFQNGTVKLVMSSGVASEMMYLHQTYTDVSEKERIMAELKQFIPEAWVDDRIIGAAAANSNQVMALIKVGPTLNSHKLVYPLQSKPMQDKKYSDDIKEALIYGHILSLYGNSPFPVTVASSLTTTDTGFVPNGRFW